MKKLLLSSIILASSLFANTKLYKDYEYNSKIIPNLKKANPEEISLFPIKENKNLKYYKAEEGVYLLYKSDKLVAVNISKETNSSLEDINKEIKPVFKEFLGSNVLELSKSKGLKGRDNLSSEDKLLKKEKENRLRATDDSIFIYTEAFKNKEKRIIVIYAEEFKKEKSCKKCDLVNEEDTKYKQKNSLIQIFSK